MKAVKLGIAWGLLAWTASAAIGQDTKIHTQLTPEQTEALLKTVGVEFKKTPTKSPTTFIYDFPKNRFNLRLYHYSGKDLMLDAVFPPLPLERVNEWNMKAKFTRASLVRSAKADYVTLESNLDLIGGVTDGALKQFFVSFDDEVLAFSQFIGSPGDEDLIFSPVAGPRIEKVLKTMGIAFEKNDLPEGAGQYYDFEVEKYKLRLTNYGGKDLMIDAHFPKLDLEEINRWNLETKFVRAVGYSIKGVDYSALEANLDCEAGTTDGILRNFIVGFREDVKQFAKYVQKEPKTK